MKRLLYIFSACLLTSIGALLLKHSGLLTGGTAGLSLALTYHTGLSFGVIFFLVNLPFYFLSLYVLGCKFTLSTLFSVIMVSVLTWMMDRWIPFFELAPMLGSLLGGVLIGLGLSTLFINKASLGGVNILALSLYKTLNWNPGKVIFVFDCFIVGFGFYSVGSFKGLLSVLSILITSYIISYFKHKFGTGINDKDKKTTHYVYKA